ncbi:MAG TPA: hypothetical protein VFC73_02110 [Syntrophomonadaceae bacterium]|nr:hypothetical protein [Syntrophomonadaceae bacterium]
MRKVVILTISILLLIPGLVIANYNPFAAGEIEGYLVNISVTPATEEDPQVVSARIETYAGQFYQIEIDAKADLLIDNRPITIYDYKPGMEVYGQLRGQKLVTLEAYSTANMGYIEPGSKLRQGVITNLESNQLYLNRADGQTGIYYISPATIVLKQGEQVTADTLYTGDAVKLYFDEIDTDMISRIEVQGESILVKDLFKGNLGQVDTMKNMITLEDVEVFRNGSWQKQSATLRIPFSRDMLAFTGSQKIPYHNLKYFKGKTAYLVTKPIMGKDVVEHLIVKNQYESAFTGKIQDLNFYASVLEIGNRNINFYDGSIVIKDGRLQENTVLSNGSDVYVLADGRGNDRIANLIYIFNQGINNSSLGQHHIYAGRLDQISQDNLWLEDFFMLNENRWESFSDVKELFYDNDTFIYDAESKKLISSLEFWAGDYSVDEDNVRDPKLKDWYAYLYTDGDRVVCISVQKKMDSLLGQRITTGRVDKVVDDSMVGWSLILNDAKDFSQVKSEWMLKTASLRLSLEDVMIIRNGKLINPEELKAGEMLYIVRDDFHSKVVIVK